MKNEGKKKVSILWWIIIGVVIIAAIVIGVIMLNKNNEANKPITEVNENGEKVNVSSKIKETKTYGEYKVSNVTLKTEEGKTAFTIDITNQTSNTIPGKLKKIVFMDKEGKEIANMGIYIRELKANETINTKATISKDLTESYDYKITDN